MNQLTLEFINKSTAEQIAAKIILSTPQKEAIKNTIKLFRNSGSVKLNQVCYYLENYLA